jgi:hypothetical protein
MLAANGLLMSAIPLTIIGLVAIATLVFAFALDAVKSLAFTRLDLAT